jgi:hypothetical protein
VTNIRKAALVAAITFAGTRIHWLSTQIVLWPQATGFHWYYYLFTLIDIVTLVPLPILFCLLYRDGDALGVSAGMRNLALAIALAIGGLFIAPGALGLKTLLPRDWHEIQWGDDTTEAGRIWSWLRKSTTAMPQFWALIAWLSLVAFAWFLVELFRKHGEPVTDDARRLYRLRELAALTTIIGGLAVVRRLGGVIVGVFVLQRRVALDDTLIMDRPLHYVVANLLGSVPEVCWMTTAWIVYRSLPKIKRDEALVGEVSL